MHSRYPEGHLSVCCRSVCSGIDDCGCARVGNCSGDRGWLAHPAEGQLFFFLAPVKVTFEMEVSRYRHQKWSCIMHRSVRISPPALPPLAGCASSHLVHGLLPPSPGFSPALTMTFFLFAVCRADNSVILVSTFLFRQHSPHYSTIPALSGPFPWGVVLEVTIRLLSLPISCSPLFPHLEFALQVLPSSPGPSDDAHLHDIGPLLCLRFRSPLYLLRCFCFPCSTPIRNRSSFSTK